MKKILAVLLIVIGVSGAIKFGALDWLQDRIELGRLADLAGFESFYGSEEDSKEVENKFRYSNDNPNYVDNIAGETSDNSGVISNDSGLTAAQDTENAAARAKKNFTFILSDIRKGDSQESILSKLNKALALETEQTAMRLAKINISSGIKEVIVEDVTQQLATDAFNFYVNSDGKTYQGKGVKGWQGELVLHVYLNDGSDFYILCRCGNILTLVRVAPAKPVDPTPTPEPEATTTPTPTNPPTTTPTPVKPGDPTPTPEPEATTTPTPTNPPPTTTPTPTDPPPTTTPAPTPEPKKPWEDPNPNGNAGEGGDRNEEDGPGSIYQPERPSLPPEEYIPPAPPVDDDTSNQTFPGGTGGNIPTQTAQPDLGNQNGTEGGAFQRNTGGTAAAQQSQTEETTQPTISQSDSAGEGGGQSESSNIGEADDTPPAVTW